MFGMAIFNCNKFYFFQYFVEVKGNNEFLKLWCIIAFFQNKTDSKHLLRGVCIVNLVQSKSYEITKISDRIIQPLSMT